jgi:hypothetical protein
MSTKVVVPNGSYSDEARKLHLSMIEKFAPVPVEDFGNVRMVWLTQELADYILSLNTNNRRRDKAREEDYAEEMLAGRWKVSNDAICVSYDLIVTNGQSRLYGFKLSKLEKIPIILKWDAPWEEFKIMDKPRLRSNAVSNGIDKAHDEVCTLFYRTMTGLSRTKTLVSGAIAEQISEAYTASCLGNKFISGSPSRGLRSAFVYAWLLANGDMHKRQLALDKWLLLTQEEFQESLISNPEETPLMAEFKRITSKATSSEFKLSQDLFLKAIPVFTQEDQSSRKLKPANLEQVKQTLSSLISLNV